MSAVVYTCPKCQTTLRPTKPVPAGKKLRCPKCENVFAPDGDGPAIQAAAPGGGPPGKDDDEEGTYGVVHDPDLEKEEDEDEDEDLDDEEEGEGRRKKRKKKNRLQSAFDPVADVDREARSMRGPAATIVTGPANALLKTSLLACICWIINFIIAMVPVLFPLDSKDDFVPQRDRIVIEGPVEKDDKFIFTLNGEKLSVDAGSTDVNEVRDNMIKALDRHGSSKNPYADVFSESTRKKGEFQIEGMEGGVPFNLEVSTTEANGAKSDNQKITKTTVQESKLPEGMHSRPKKDKEAEQMDREFHAFLMFLWSVYWFLAVFGTVVCLPYSCVIAIAGIKLQKLESYVLGLIGSIMSILPIHMAGPSLLVLVIGFVATLVFPCLGCLLLFGALLVQVPLPLWGLFSGIRCLVALRNPVVVEGFYEKPKY